MAIDFGRMARGVVTGYLDAKIRNTEANDQLKANIIEAAGIDYYQNEEPKLKKQEETFEKEYSQISGIYGKPFADALVNQKFITGDGTALENVQSILEKSNINVEALKTMKFPSFEEAKKQMVDKRKQKEQSINNLIKNGFGANTSKSLLEDIKIEPTTKIDTTAMQPDTTIEPGLVETAQTPRDITSETLFTPKMSGDVEGAQTRYRQIATAVNELGGYTNEIITDPSGNVNFNLFGENRNEAAAHIALANRLVIQNPEQYNQYNAASTAKQQLDFLTVMPFNSIADELNIEYTPARGSTLAKFIGQRDIDVNQILKTGKTVDATITDQLDAIPVDPMGEPNQAVLTRFIENIPDNLIVEIEGEGGKKDTINYKTYIKSLVGIDTASFWQQRKI
jgi:hypothetical protein